MFQEYKNGENSAVSSSYVWICMTGHGGTEVSVADANDLSSVLDKFRVSSSHILCIAGVPGTYCLLLRLCIDLKTGLKGSFLFCIVIETTE